MLSNTELIRRYKLHRENKLAEKNQSKGLVSTLSGTFKKICNAMAYRLNN
jgi:hypothetical protein